MTKSKTIIVATLVIACIAVTALLFWPDRQEATSTAPDRDASASPDTPMPVTQQTDRLEQPSAEPTDATTPSDWNIYHGDNALRGATRAAAPDDPVVLWTLLAGAPVRQPPVVHNNVVFAITARGVVIAADLEGQEIWRRDLNTPEPDGENNRSVRIEAPLTAVAGRVFAGTDMGMLFGLDAKTGAELWRTDIGGPVRGAINYSDDGAHIFVLDQDAGALVCLDAAGGAQVWRSTGVDRSDGSPAIVGDIAVFGSCASAMHVVATTTGELLRDIAIENGGGQIAGGIALAEGHAYAGVRDGRIMRADLASGVLAWTTDISMDEVFATPAVRDDWVLVTAHDGRLYALDRASGAVPWQYDLEGMPSSPIIVGDNVIVSADGMLFLLRLEDGAPVWQKRLADEITAPAVIPDMVFVGGEDGTIVALGNRP